VIKVSDEKTKVECRLITKGTDKVNVSVVDDLAVPDPEPAVGKRIIQGELEDDDQPDNS
jgi:hypothetical protein